MFCSLFPSLPSQCHFHWYRNMEFASLIYKAGMKCQYSLCNWCFIPTMYFIGKTKCQISAITQWTHDILYIWWLNKEKKYSLKIRFLWNSDQKPWNPYTKKDIISLSSRIIKLYFECSWYNLKYVQCDI